MSTMHLPGFFSTLCLLNKEKQKCFLPLSKGTTRKEREDFVDLDMKRAIMETLGRFDAHPEERDENLPLIAKMIRGEDFGKEDEQKIMDMELPSYRSWRCDPCDNAAIAGLI